MPPSEPLALVVAYDRHRCIGKDGGLPWHEPEDLKRFKRMTLGHAVILGRTTHASIGKALPGRRNLVLTRSKDAVIAAECERFASFDEALAAARTTDPCPQVIGGEAVYRAALPLATLLHVTEMDLVVEGGDAWFPDVDASAWREISRVPAPHGRFTYVDYERV
ncbi:MAG: dihydrofolate reductase [Planctomycetota bacterium]